MSYVDLALEGKVTIWLEQILLYVEGLKKKSLLSNPSNLEKQKTFIYVYQRKLFVCHVEISQTIVPLAHLVLLKGPHWVYTMVPLHSWYYWKDPIEFRPYCPCTLGTTKKPPMSLYHGTFAHLVLLKSPQWVYTYSARVIEYWTILSLKISEIFFKNLENFGHAFSIIENL
jgi:hypothetical protein